MPLLKFLTVQFPVVHVAEAAVIELKLAFHIATRTSPFVTLLESVSLRDVPEYTAAVEVCTSMIAALACGAKKIKTRHIPTMRGDFFIFHY